MIRSIFGHLPKHLLHRYFHNSLGLVHSFSQKKGLPGQKQSVLEFTKKKEIVDELKQTLKQKEIVAELEQTKKEKEIVDELKQTSKQKQMGKETKQLSNEQQSIVRELKTFLQKASKFFGVISFILGVVGLYYAYQSYQVQYKATKKYKWAKARQQHLKDFEQNNTFVHGKSVENKIRSIFEQNQNTLELILGVEGIGKTQAAKQLITERREKAKKEQREERIYFISLKIFQQKSNKHDTNKNSQKMLQLIHAISSQYDGSVPTTLVIDDINQLETIQNTQDRIQKQGQIIKLSQSGVKVILISSSTGFYHKIWIDELFRKYGNKRQHIIWMMNEQQSKQILQKKGQQLKIDKKIIQKVISFGVPLRDSITLLVKISKWKLTQNKLVMEKLQEEYKRRNLFIKKKLERVLHKMDQRASYQIIKGLTQNKMHKDVSTASLKNCLELQENVKILKKQKMLPSQAIDALDKENLIIMCYPRSRLIMKVFQEKLKQLETK